MVPDAEYFIRFRVLSIYSHSLAGVFWFDLPLALLCAFLFHLIVRDPLIHHLPPLLRRRLKAYLSFDWARYFCIRWYIVILSTLPGAISHLAWDGFTHAGGYFVQHWPWLGVIVNFGNVALPAYKLLQHGSSVAGLLVIAWCLLHLPVLTPQWDGDTAIYYWPGIGLLTIAIVTMRLLAAQGNLAAGHVIVSFIAAFLIALLLVSVLTRKRRTGYEGTR